MLHKTLQAPSPGEIDLLKLSDSLYGLTHDIQPLNIEKPQPAKLLRVYEQLIGLDYPHEAQSYHTTFERTFIERQNRDGGNKLAIAPLRLGDKIKNLQNIHNGSHINFDFFMWNLRITRTVERMKAWGFVYFSANDISKPDPLKSAQYLQMLVKINTILLPKVKKDYKYDSHPALRSDGEWARLQSEITKAKFENEVLYRKQT